MLQYDTMHGVPSLPLCCQSTVFIASKSFGLCCLVNFLFLNYHSPRSVSACILSTVDPCWGTFASVFAEAMAFALIILVVYLDSSWGGMGRDRYR